MKTQPTPKMPISTPASSGPTTRDVAITVEFSDTALRIWASSTRSAMKARRTGLSMALAAPPTQRQGDDHGSAGAAGEGEHAERQGGTPRTVWVT